MANQCKSKSLLYLHLWTFPETERVVSQNLRLENFAVKAVLPPSIKAVVLLLAMNLSGAQISMRRAALLICHVAAPFRHREPRSIVKPSWLMANLGNETFESLSTQKLDRKSNSEG